MRTSCFIFLCIFLFINSCLFSQGNAANPDAAGTSKQSQIPVNLSTGVPQIGFPLASLEGKSMVLQFSLGYDASGRKINESAQSTGWGWNVSGGGQIVRNIRGDKDEKHFPLGYVSDIPAGTGTPWIEDFKAQQGKYMPDEYFFNVNGLSGSFVINTEGEAVLLPYQDIKINFEFPFYFEIIDDSGFRYRFEDSSISYYGIEGEEESEGAVTAWYLSRIFDPQGQEEFYFNYEHGGYTVMKTYSIDESWYFGDNCPRSIHSENTYVSRTEILNLVLVHSNLTDKGLGFWRITPRLDEPETYCLDEIRNFKSGQFLGGVKLGYDYFKNELNQPERLKLISMSTISSDLIYEEIVSFEYNESLIIKSDERIIGQDHWGYYNGLDLSSVQDNHIHGGRRRVDPNKNQLGILKKLNYTSGKSVTLEFESNTYSESPFGSVIPQLNSPVLMTGLLQINDEDIFNYDLDDTDQGFIFSGPDQGLNFAGQPNNIFENLTGQCDFGYTFYNSSTDYSLNPEIGGDGFFAPDDLADIDHPNNGMNQDLFESEIVIFPYPKSKIQSQQFTIDNGQNITISGTIAPSFCTSLLSYISIRSTTTPAEEIWRLDGQLDYDVVFSNTMYLAEGSYIIDYVIVYPLFDGIPAGYVPRKDISGSWSTSFEFTFLPLTIPQPNNFTNYCGGLRIKSVFENAEDFTTSAGFKTEYSYNTFLDPTKSSGYLFSDPIYNDYRDYYYSSWYRNGVGCTGDTVFCSECDVLIKNSNGLNSLKLVNGSCVGYSNITVKQSELETESENGRIEYEYSVHPSDNDNLLFGFSYPYQNWRNGLLTATRVYNSTGILLQKTESEFEVISIENSSASGLGQAISQLRPLAKRKRVCVSDEVPLCDYRYSAQMLPYNYTSEIIRLKNSSSFAYDQVDPSKFSNSITHYSYQSYSPALVSKVTNYTNDPVLPVTETRIKYVGDYSSDGNGSAMKMALNHLNITVGYGKATPIETINLAGISESLLNVYSGQITTLRLVNINFPVVDASYQLVLESPISLSDFNLSSVEGALFVMNSNYRKRTGDFIYDSEANLICSQQINGVPTSKILNSENLVIAEVLNSRPGECFYNSFEVNEFNSWNYLEEAIIQQEVSVLGLTLTRSKTGLRALSLIESIQRELPAGKYTVSLWSNSPSFSLSLNGVVQTSSISNEGLDLLGWRYNEYILELESTSTIVISGGSNILIDELRVYPSDARMTTLAYNFDGSLRNKCDNNNYVTTTLYDTW